MLSELGQRGRRARRRVCHMDTRRFPTPVFTRAGVVTGQDDRYCPIPDHPGTIVTDPGHSSYADTACHFPVFRGLLRPTPGIHRGSIPVLRVIATPRKTGRERIVCKPWVITVFRRRRHRQSGLSLWGKIQGNCRSNNRRVPFMISVFARDLIFPRIMPVISLGMTKATPYCPSTFHSGVWADRCFHHSSILAPPSAAS